MTHCAGHVYMFWPIPCRSSVCTHICTKSGTLYLHWKYMAYFVPGRLWSKRVECRKVWLPFLICSTESWSTLVLYYTKCMQYKLATALLNCKSINNAMSSFHQNNFTAVYARYLCVYYTFVASVYVWVSGSHIVTHPSRCIVCMEIK